MSLHYHQNHHGTNIKTVLGDNIIWDNAKLPLHGCQTKDPTQLRRCRKHKRIEATCMLTLSHGSTFLDCGSHFGDTVLTMAIHARAHDRHDLKFIAFEPCRRKCKFIRAMVKLNQLQKAVKIVNACIGDGVKHVARVEERKFAKYDGRTAYHQVSNENVSGQVEEEGEEQTTEIQDNIQQKHGLKRRTNSVYYYNIDDPDIHDSGSESGDSDESDDETDGINDDHTNIPMISLDSMKDDIMPLGFLHLDVEGWESQALLGASAILQQTLSNSYIICEVWDKKDRMRRKKAIESQTQYGTNIPSNSLCDDGHGEKEQHNAKYISPENELVSIMSKYPQFQRQDDIVDQDHNLFFSTIS
jgi:FkbM family methyltransferase